MDKHSLSLFLYRSAYELSNYLFLQCPASLSKMHTHLPGEGEAHMRGNDHNELGGGQLGPFCTSNIEPDSNRLRHLPVRVDGLLYTKPQAGPIQHDERAW